MTWSFDQTLAEPKDRVRDLVGDVDPATHLTLGTTDILSDEQIAFYLSAEASEYMAAARAAEVLAAAFARQADKAVGDYWSAFSQKSRAFRDLAADLRARKGVYAIPQAGGISIQEKRQLEEDIDRESPDFWRGQHDHVGGSTNPNPAATGPWGGPGS